ncbi:aminopeptidase N [Malaya genurostris]|uniref:aminopeptidase N n=1 Tax=Malaya genurostris TaxID=325434 RepID=UPI0026F4077E|nr:aminopeptidase N [Malaya genurostris]XP_058467775.1 aminopeptidase N [Malaya genurostris]XP_058467776.1 aminopeptidase N [Malaya genurostris]XP_058467777.1 aminopeptidase N [Malaya genurostris]XP_058467778.1 aminopeptidase N [Malaya genurostris]XP_058467779.1 aminopeptidase N [Malaya genurostris]
MNNSKMQIRESFTADGATRPYSENRGYFITRMTLLTTMAILSCLVVGTGLLIYQFASCQEAPVHASISDHHFHFVTNHTRLHIDTTSMPARTDIGTVPLTTSTSSTISITETIDSVTVGDQSNTSHNKSVSEDDNLRLPRSIEPIAYNIRLIPFIFENNFTFTGKIGIELLVKEDCDNITLHAVALKIHEAYVQRHELPASTEKADTSDSRYTRRLRRNREFTSDDNQISDDDANLLTHVEIERQYIVDSKQFLVLKLKEKLKIGERYTVHIKFDGILNDYLQGFYRSSYTVQNETRWLATTQFQPTDARRAFPCFDEPALKARFSISLARPRHMTSLSNMPKISSYSASEDGLKDYVWDVYQQSLPMPTYLVAFVVCDFVNLTSNNFAVWARSDAIISSQYALDIGPKILKYLEEFFDIEYPLPKMDMIALPDFSAGAMENWGLITYRETAMLYETNISAKSNKQRVVTVVAHELAHQWFGNLVTPSWWTDLWLNEGFASYMEYLGVDAVEPAWKSMEQFVVNELHNVFSLDALSSSHQISVNVHNPEEINEIFDKISYGKGAAIIRMMDHFLTAVVFRKGLTNYLNDKKYQSAEQDDLWMYLTEAARAEDIFDGSTTVKEIMDTWTLQTGFPVVKVTRDYDSKSIEFFQERFIFIEPFSNTSDKSYEKPLWWIPITYTTLGERNFNNTKPYVWMKAEEKLLLQEMDIPNHDWIIVNIQQTGYYRVNYDQQNWDMIINHLRDRDNFKSIAPSNRAQLIDDALNLARGGYLNYSIALNITRYLVHETDYVPWKAAINALNFIDSMLIKTSNYFRFKKYSLHLLKPIYAKVGFDDSKDSSLLTIYKRVDVLTSACHLGYRECVSKCVQKFYEWMHEVHPDINNPISPNLKNIVYCTAIKYGDEAEWDFAWQRFQKTTISSEKETLLSALGCSRETWILTRFLEYSMTDEYGIRKQDVFRVFLAVSNNVIGQPIAFSYIRNNWKKMKEYLGTSMSNLNMILKYSTKRLNTQYELDELKEFAQTQLKDTGRTIQQAIERAQANILWMDMNANTIDQWLSEVIYDPDDI